MPDLLVRLYDLPPLSSVMDRMAAEGITIRRALAPEKHLVLGWAEVEFSKAWSSECDIAFARVPLACFLATHGERLLGFCAYEVTCRGFLGPLGVCKTARGSGIGSALLLHTLHSMRTEGHAYAIIGYAGPAEFFMKTVGAIAIPGSDPGIYAGMLRRI